MGKIILKNLKETQAFAEKIARQIIDEPRRDHATVVALVGELGAGKTTFVSAFAKALSVRGRVTSPTFPLMKRFALHGSHFANFYHIDAYRLRDATEFTELGFGDILRRPQHIIVIEWADRVRDLLPDDAVWMTFQHGENDSERSVEVK